MDKKYIIALDQGTTSSRAIIFDKNLNIIEKILANLFITQLSGNADERLKSAKN